MAGDRLTALDASFLHMEDGGAHMHVASVLVFGGEPPAYDDLVDAVRGRLHLVPRYRQKLAHVPFGQGRPRWVDDPSLNLRYHVRHTALPPPGNEEQLRALAGRVFAQRLDRDKPLWEIWLVTGLEGEDGAGERFAMLTKTHHALVDGVSGVDIGTVIFDASPEPEQPPAEEKRRWLPAPTPSRSQLLAEALLERMVSPAEAARTVRAALRGPRRVAEALRDAAVGVGAMAWAGLNPPPPSPYNGPIGPHRRFTWVRVDLGEVKAIKNELGGTVNDVMLATVAGGLGRHLRRRGEQVDGLELKAMVPVSVRADVERGALGNRVAAMMAPLPVWCENPSDRLARVSRAMAGLKESGQAVGAQTLTELGNFAPPTILDQAARLIPPTRFFNLVVTNVPGPQFPLYLMGRRLVDIFPMAPLARDQGIGIAIMSYDGAINFGLLADWDLVPDVADLAGDLEDALAELREEAGVRPASAPATAPSASPEKTEA